MDRTIGVILNGVTGRMGTNQHLIRSILSIREQGGVGLADGSRIMPEPLLVGRNETKLANLSRRFGELPYTTDLDGALGDSKWELYFDSSATELRAANLKKAIAAGKSLYCEKPTAASLDDALEVARAAKRAGTKNGVVQDKLWLPGLMKLKYLIDTGFFGRIISVQADFGYWVFDGFYQATQRPSWNYRKEDGGSIIVDMFCHWRYVIDQLFGPVEAVMATARTLIPERLDERGKRYTCTADDAAYAFFELADGLLVRFNSSWQTRVRRDDLLTIQVDGTDGSAVAGLRDCVVQPDSTTPKPVWNPDIDSPIDFFAGWTPMPTRDPFENAFKAQWELFLKHLAGEGEFPWDLLEGAKGVQLAEAGLESASKRQWVKLDPITL